MDSRLFGPNVTILTEVIPVKDLDIKLELSLQFDLSIDVQATDSYSPLDEHELGLMPSCPLHP
jgi:hypothetical protein